ncbi:MAG: nucleoid-associated protein [Bacillota bacterium]|nr:nucleoid-associated protein [Bacillota bacterium]
MDFKIQKAILHILGTNGSLPVYSQKELDVSEEVIFNFIGTHVKKVYQDDTTRVGNFNPDSFLLTQVVQLDESFVYSSRMIANHLSDILKQHSEVPSADVLIAIVTIDEIPHAAIIKFNYKEGYTHFVDYDETGTNNKIILHKVIFASETQKNDEGALVNLQDFSLRIVEKAYNIDGEKKYYFSELFLDCKTDLSEKDSIKVIGEMAKDITRRYYNDDFEKLSAVKTVIHDSVEGEGNINLDRIANTCFNDSPTIRMEYLQKVKQAGVPATIQVSGDSPERKFNKHKIKTDNGIELSIPMDVYKNKEVIEFITSADGTISIVLKNINRLINK